MAGNIRDNKTGDLPLRLFLSSLLRAEAGGRGIYLKQAASVTSPADKYFDRGKREGLDFETAFKHLLVDDGSGRLCIQIHQVTPSALTRVETGREEGFDELDLLLESVVKDDSGKPCLQIIMT